MKSLTIQHGCVKAIPFSITGANLGALRVTYAIAKANAPAARSVLKKVGGLPGPSADITISEQLPGSIKGTVVLTAADFLVLLPGDYIATIWVDDGTSPVAARIEDEVTGVKHGAHLLVVEPTAPRLP